MLKYDAIQLEQAARCLRVMAHPTRLLILHLLGESDHSVGELEKLLNISQSNLSQHLSLLKDKNLLASRRVGNQRYYSLKDKRLLGLLALMQDLFEKT
ncbi:MAG: winged helix-turn-helix transcriptional regulator [Deltaproteobacteria bacterium]|nr:winged helix-turn-helix transcriptional regulator [Deltaproteobacteria bacterium]